MPYSLFRPLLFALDPEHAHAAAFAALDAAARLGLARPATRPATAPVCVMGLGFPNRVGLAAGLDKNAAHLPGLASLGFGFIEVGTVTPRAQPGNARPRMWRLPAADALINRLGFNNDGVAVLCANIARAGYRGVLGINIGKNFDTPNERAADDYVHCLEAVYPLASYVTINVSSPNTRGLRDLQRNEALDALLATLTAAREALSQKHARRVPLAVKIAPDLDAGQIDRIADALVAHGIDAVIATNTTIARDAVVGLAHAEEPGGLSGRPLLAQSNRVIAALAGALQGAVPIIGVGGILSADDARAKIDAGASLVQLYTGLIYRGPRLVAQCAEALSGVRAGTGG
ncbi:MAG: quinone-dependent dihydroorotate dehydrogenase [Casimicrobiaceae bacterium]